MQEEILQDIKAFVYEITGKEVEIKEDSELDSSIIGMSSLNIVELLVKMEEIYKIQIPDSSLNIKKVGNMVSIIEEQRNRLKKRDDFVTETVNKLFT
jgi:acyl carrier protein